MPDQRAAAYFSMEIAVDPAMPTYSGGLGILAGDTLRSAADEGVPLVGMTLLHRKGYLCQAFDASGWQHELPAEWKVEEHVTEMPARVSVQLENRTVQLRAWRFEVKGNTSTVPVFLLDADLPANSAWDRTLTDYLYGGDASYRLCQEVILGVGGVRMLRALGYAGIARFHLNEGHASLLTLELLDEGARAAERRTLTPADIDAVRRRCIFTTHTPVPAGHDQFPLDLVGRVLGERFGYLRTDELFGAALIEKVLQSPPAVHDPAGIFRSEHILNLTYLALNLSHYVNGVAKRHAEVSQQLFSKYHIDEITNGVHAATWTAPAFRRLFDQYIPGWEADNFSLRYALNIPRRELWSAHSASKGELFAMTAARSQTSLDPAKLTLGFARRMTSYKRADLLFTDTTRLRSVAKKLDGLQVIFAGKAHANDAGGKEIIQHIRRIRDSLLPEVRIVYLENYDMELAKLLVAGVDVWVNTPLPPLEASGTSGMKAALNGVPSLSILDGWWLEGCIEGITGWSIGEKTSEFNADNHRNTRDAASLYDRIENVVGPLYHSDRDRFIDVMRHAIALNGSFFNTQRMIQQYVAKAYFA